MKAAIKASEQPVYVWRLALTAGVWSRRAVNLNGTFDYSIVEVLLRALRVLRGRRIC